MPKVWDLGFAIWRLERGDGRGQSGGECPPPARGGRTIGVSRLDIVLPFIAFASPVLDLIHPEACSQGAACIPEIVFLNETTYPGALVRIVYFPHTVSCSN